MLKSIKMKKSDGLRPGIVRAAKIHIALSLILAAQTLLYDAGKLITPDVVLKRWLLIGLVAIAASVVWYLARSKDEARYSHRLVWSLIAVDMLVASYFIYSQRGMASRAVILFAIPILTAAVLRQKGAIYLTAATAATVYLVTAIAYFVLNFNEGYKLELYGELSFYGGVLFCIAGLSWALVRTKR